MVQIQWFFSQIKRNIFYRQWQQNTLNFTHFHLKKRDKNNIYFVAKFPTDKINVWLPINIFCWQPLLTCASCVVCVAREPVKQFAHDPANVWLTIVVMYVSTEYSYFLGLFGAVKLWLWGNEDDLNWCLKAAGWEKQFKMSPLMLITWLCSHVVFGVPLLFLFFFFLLLLLSSSFSISSTLLKISHK